MILGTVNSILEAVVSLRIRGPSGVVLNVDIVVDTGFTDWLTLPGTSVISLGLQRTLRSQATMADGSVSFFDVYSAEVEWDGQWQQILAYDMGNETLLGMSMIAGHSLRIDAVAGGTVEITPLP
jgi:clan AA aspartic protease